MTLVANSPGNFVPIRWTFTNAAARAALVASDSDVLALAYQADDDSVWVLVDASPLTWAPVGSGGGGLSAYITAPGELPRMPFSEVVSTNKPVTSSGTGTGDPNDLTGGDSDPFTTDAPGNGEWVKVDMEAPIELGYIRLIQEADGDHQATDYLLEYSLDNAAWSTASTRGSLPGDEDLVPFSEGPKTGRYWRLTCTGGAVEGWTINELGLGDQPVIGTLDFVGGRYLKSGAFTYSWEEIDLRDMLNVQGEDYEDGDILYYDDGQWRKLAPGTDGDVLTLVSGLPAWVTP